MYCYTYVNEFACIFNELQLWSHISSDHPNFLKTVAALSNVVLPKETINQLEEIHQIFHRLYKHVVHLKKVVSKNPRVEQQEVVAVKKAIDEFILHDAHTVSFYPQLLDFGKDNMAWQELVKHIINEQAFMLDLFEDLRLQL